MPKKKQTAEEIAAEIESVDQEITELEGAKLAEERSALTEPLRSEQVKVMERYRPFEEAVTEVHSVWKEIGTILTESEQLRKEVDEARELGRESPDVAPVELQALSLPESLVTTIPDQRNIGSSLRAHHLARLTRNKLRSLNILSGHGDKMKVCGRRYISHRIRQQMVNGLTNSEQRALL